MSTALKDYEEALHTYVSLDGRDRHEEARTLHAMGEAYEVQGNPDRALELFDSALKGWLETGDLAQAGDTYNSIAKLADDRGDWQEALDNYEEALTHYERGEAIAKRGKAAIRRTRAITLYNLGFTYAALGDYQKAFDLLRQSLALRDNPRGRGITYMAIGYFQALAGEPREALKSCDLALPLQKEAGDPRESHTLTVMGIARAALNEHTEALALYNQALEIQQNKDRPDPQAEAITQGKRGDSLAALGDGEQALAAYGRARQLYRDFKDRNGESVALFGMARVQSTRNNLTTALKLVEDAIEAAEPLRANVTSQQLRVSYFAAKVNCYELYIDLSMRLRADGNEMALAAAAFEASERARARSLLDILSQARVEAGRKANPELAALTDKYVQLQREIQSKKALKELAQSSKEPSGSMEVDGEIAKLYAERESTEAQVRSRYPRYAALMYPQPLTAASVQSLLDEDTLLLEFALGEERSYVWALTASTLQGYALPPRSMIEATARQLSNLLRAGQPLPNESAARRAARSAQAVAEYWPLAAQFSRILLGPVAPLLKKRRILIVADGQLSYLPFGALPPPASDFAQGASLPQAPTGAPLITDHEIVSLPSASVLSVLRQTARREPATKSVAVFADPVFEKDDPRLQLAIRVRPAAPEQRVALTRALRDTDGGDGDVPKLPRLLASGREARDILALTPPGSSMEATGFKASRENLTDVRLSQYRIVHLATHGILNEENPDLSGVVLSLYDEQGRFRENGFLRLGDIFRLSLPVDLIVLSACRTGLGKEARGEGLIGLTRGFMYAGAARVIASLWKVDDDATAELMKRFYQKMLKDGMTPASALRAAQVSMSVHRRWGNPYYWAGFILQGEPR
jgi:CHAT domain-containing protein